MCAERAGLAVCAKPKFPLFGLSDRKRSASPSAMFGADVRGSADARPPGRVNHAAPPHPSQQGGHMPLIQVKVIEGVFTTPQKQEILERLTESMVEIEGENLRQATLVRPRRGQERRLGHRRLRPHHRRRQGARPRPSRPQLTAQGGAPSRRPAPPHRRIRVAGLRSAFATRSRWFRCSRSPPPLRPSNSRSESRAMVRSASRSPFRAVITHTKARSRRSSAPAQLTARRQPS